MYIEVFWNLNQKTSASCYGMTEIVCAVFRLSPLALGRRKI